MCVIEEQEKRARELAPEIHLDREMGNPNQIEARSLEDLVILLIGQLAP